MDNKEFDDKFAKAFENEAEFDFREEDWKELSGQLQGERSRRIPLFWWLFGGALLLAIISLSWIVNNAFQNQQRQIENLKQEITQIEQSNPIIDTVFMNQTVTQYDTIVVYKNQVIYKTKTLSTDLATFQIQNKEQNAISSSSPLPNNYSLDQSPSPVLKNNYPPKAIENQFTSKDFSIARWKQYSFLPLRTTLLQNQPFFFLSKKSSTLTPSSKPKPSFFLGPYYTYSVPEDYINSEAQADSLKRVAHSVGLNLKYKLNNKFSINGRVGYEWLNFATNTSFGGVPDYTGQFEDFFVSGFVKQRRWVYQLGLSYSVFSFSKLHTTVHLSFEGQSNLYQFVNRYFDAAYIQLNEEDENSLNAFRLNSAIIGPGINYQLNDYTLFQLNPWFRIPINENEQQMYSRVGLSTSILYKF